MYITTRNFLLYLLSAAFLIVAITTTVVSESTIEPPLVSETTQSLSEAVVYSGSVSTGHDLDRPSQLIRLKQKISQLQASVSALVNNEAELEEVIVRPEISEPVTPVVSGKPFLCAGYGPDTIMWPNQGVKLAVVEGARLVFTETVPTVTTLSASNTEDVTPVKTVLLQLSLFSQPEATPHCLESEVIGVALDGSLMRNNETSLYGIFGADTLLGYALDGFPIYGSGTVVMDSCGGAMVAGQYRYNLKQDRETLINCFASSPAVW